MSICPGISYSAQAVGRPDKGGFSLYTEIKMINDLLGALEGGFPCADVEAAIPAFLSALWNKPVEDGDSIEDPGFNSGSLLNVDIPTFSGYSIGITIDGASAGTLDWTLVDTDVVYTNNSTVAFPIVAGVDFLNSISFSSIGGIGCDGVAWDPVQSIGGFADAGAINDWFCCLSAPYACCGSAVFFGGRFLIPSPDSPAPGEENISTPLLRTPLYLSNHTYQFTKNFGRIKK